MDASAWGWGAHLGEQAAQGRLVQGRGQKIFQLEGSNSDSPESSLIPAIHRKSPRAGSVTQQDSSPVSDKTGWHKEQGSYAAGSSDPILGGIESSFAISSSPETF